MKVRVIDRFGNVRELTNIGGENIPMIGDKVEWVYFPHPTVTERLWSATESLLTIIVE
jgi:hypothetical protein